jgi:hypothetical protein
MEEARVMTSG